jgi:hypothetical protein
MSTNRSPKTLSTPRVKLLQRLDESERQLALGQRNIDEQYRRIAELQRDRLETSMSLHLLHTLFETQRDYENERNRILEALAKENSETAE